MKTKILSIILSVFGFALHTSANEKIYVNREVTTHIVMSENIKLVDISTTKIIGNQCADTDNVISSIDDTLRILLLTSSLPAKAMDACYSDIQHTPVILVEIDISLRIEDVEFCSKHQFDSIELAWNTMKVSEIDRITGTRDIGTVLCDSQDIQPFLLCCQGHFLQTAKGMT